MYDRYERIIVKLLNLTMTMNGTNVEETKCFDITIKGQVLFQRF